MARRGTYAKGDAKRQEILEIALRLVGEKGYSNATLREIGDEAGLSKNGLLHHFESKDELFTQVLIRRDELARTQYAAPDANGTIDSIVDYISHYSEMPGLAQLYVRLAAEASEPGHPAHDYFTQRFEQVRGEFTQAFEGFRQSGQLRADLDPTTCATLLVASIEGLQSQWLYDDKLDLGAHVLRFFAMLGVDPAGPMPASDDAVELEDAVSS